ncbi:MAG: hypothetical protein HY725_18140 [Candidatus Rokubacteria bacterium]|nr:hypothetical protein [Candidatus Rokubacteria bacterium]
MPGYKKYIRIDCPSAVLTSPDRGRPEGRGSPARRCSACSAFLVKDRSTNEWAAAEYRAQFALISF